MTQLITPQYLESLRSSDYKNSIYAFAEIIDNSIDASAKNIEVLFKTKLIGSTHHIEDIFFIDNGCGIPHDQINRVVIFSVTGNIPGDSSNKTGRFGVGLPNSSFSQTRSFIVSSRDENDQWAHLGIDLDRMLQNDSLEVPQLKHGVYDSLSYALSKTVVHNPRTVIHWKRPDQLDFSDPSFFYSRFEPLIGRIYRYFLYDDKVKISLSNHENENEPVILDIRPYDPMFLMSTKSIVYDILIADIAKDPQGDLPKRPKKYLEEFVDQKNKKVKALYQELVSHTHGNIKVRFKDKEYKLSIKSSYAFKDIQKPGMYAPGAIGLGKTMRKKMVGGKYGPGGNISWVRNGREIDCGNYNLFNVSEEKSRWWSIEISYETANDPENVIDRLLGLSNTKQSFKFKPSTGPESINEDTNNEAVARKFLMTNLTIELNSALNELRKRLSAQAKVYKLETEPTVGSSAFPGPQPGTERVLIDALGVGEQLSEIEQTELSQAISRHLPGVSIQNIKDAVQQYSDIGIRNIPIYCQLHPTVFFEAQRFQGRVLTLINTEHPFYQNVIQPLKEKSEMDIIVSTELLISTLTKSAIESPVNQQDTILSYQSKIANTLSDLLTRQSEIILPTSNDDEDVD